MMKKNLCCFLLAGLLIALTACSTAAQSDDQTSAWVIEQSAQAVATNQEAAAAGTYTEEYDADDLNDSLEDPAMALIKLEGDSISFEGSGASVDGSTITITAPGVYSISGTLDDGQILVDSAVDGTLRLILNGATINNSTSAPIFINNADKVVITLADGTQNYVSDGSTYVYASADINEPNAAIFSNDDLTFNGSGSLTVNANYNNGIQTDDDLKIISGTFMVKAVHDGIKGKDSITIKDGTLTVNAGADGLQSDNDQEADKGAILIEGGTFNIIAALDGIQAETNLSIYGGTFTIASGGGSANSINPSNAGGDRMQPNDQAATASTESMKGLKAGANILIAGGVFNIDSADDSLNSNGTITLDEGELNLTSGDDGMHANTSLTVNGGTLNIAKSYEGIESALITINNGILHITSSDDGINVAGGNDASALGNRPGQNEFTANTAYYLYINDGYICIDAGGDGLDSNGSIDMNGGTVIVNGPTSDGNGALDYQGTFTLDGGFLVAAGSAGMAMTPSADSTQYSVLVNFTAQVSAGTLLHFETSAGEEIVTFVPGKVYQSILISTPAIQNGDTLNLYYGGTSTGTLQDGLYTGGSYSAGTLVTTLEISSVVTGSGSSGMLPGGGGKPGGGRGR
jgi:hypothetical protein